MEREKYAEREEIQKKLRNFLEGRPEIAFAYLHGTFVSEKRYNDIDIGVYVRNDFLENKENIDYEATLSIALRQSLGKPVDIKVLNNSPVAFRYHAARGILLFSKDETRREDFLCHTWSEYFDFRHGADIYMREVMNA